MSFGCARFVRSASHTDVKNLWNSSQLMDKLDSSMCDEVFEARAAATDEDPEEGATSSSPVVEARVPSPDE